MRHKLADYYASEGKHDPIRIEIPLGHYVPAFEHNEEPLDATQPAPVSEEAVERKRPIAYAAILVGALGALALGLAFWFGRTTAPQSTSVAAASLPASPAIRELWGPWLDSGQAPTIVFSSPLGAVVKHYPDPLAPDSSPPRLPVPPSLETAFRSRHWAAAGASI